MVRWLYQKEETKMKRILVEIIMSDDYHARIYSSEYNELENLVWHGMDTLLTLKEDETLIVEPGNLEE